MAGRKFHDRAEGAGRRFQIVHFKRREAHQKMRFRIGAVDHHRRLAALGRLDGIAAIEGCKPIAQEACNALFAVGHSLTLLARPLV